MAIINAAGERISYDASALIAELKEDIKFYGKSKMIPVIVQEHHGVTVYKDYLLSDEDVKLTPKEHIVHTTMGELLKKYEEENSIL